ncbi:MAG: hypothetical protein ACTS43_00330 [Candidatus Hodgkinia cicadicola]
MFHFVKSVETKFHTNVLIATNLVQMRTDSLSIAISLFLLEYKLDNQTNIISKKFHFAGQSNLQDQRSELSD